jgi:hypothetical protein
MAYFKYAYFLSQQNLVEFDQTVRPGTPTGISGIYRCTGCGLSITSVHPYPLPPQNHHQHESVLIPILSQLVVKSHFKH